MRVLSLFSGVGGFDMGLEAAGMTTVFQCEIDKHARSVLDYHWPDVPKWDDVSTLTGAHILEVTGGVDVVAWGSPCQDLSLAGKRAGLSGERSGLFHQGIRIIKELRELSNGKYPTWSIWENVVGALSSNGGADFGEVLHEMDEAGACFSEWTVLDAQYFGVPQRRRRVFVTSCFDSATSERCGSPLFPVCESVSGDSSEGSKKKQGVARSTQDRIGTGGQWAAGSNTDGVLTTSVTSKWHKGTGGPSGSEHYNLVVEPFEATPIQDGREIEKHQNGLGVGNEGDPMYTLDQTGGQAVAYPIDTRNALRDPDKKDAVNRQGLGVGNDGEPSPTLTDAFVPAVAYSIREDATANNFSATEIETARALQALQPSVQSHHAQTFITQPILLDGRRVDDVRVYSEPVQTLQERMGTGGNNVPVVAQETPIIIDRAAYNQGENARYEPVIEESQTVPSLVARGPHAVGHEVQAISYDGYNQKLWEEQHVPLRTQGDASDFVADLREPTLIVRRLTPLECERLMGWPDNHTAQGTNGAVSDTNRYKMCGNGIASPVAQWIAKHILATRPDAN